MPTILVVDDEAQIRNSLEGVLEDEGYKALLAESGEECLEILSEKSVDVVLLDIWLPGIDGLETLEKLVEQEDHPMVVMISGHGNIETAVRATKLGAFDFVEKPLSLEKTTQSVKRALEFLRLESENRRLREELGLAEFFAEAPIFRFEAQEFERSLHGLGRFLERERFFDEVERAQLRGANGRFDIAVSRNHDDHGEMAVAAHALERFNSIHFRKPNVKQDQIDLSIGQALQALLAGAHRFDRVAFLGED